MRNLGKLIIAATFGFLALAPAMADETSVVVYSDRATVIRVDERASTVVIGNPVYADAVMRPGNVMVVTGKTPGTTNLIVLDSRGDIISERTLHVTTDQRDMVIMHRGNQRYTFSCAIRCENAPQVGDNADYMDNTIRQTRDRLDLSTSEASR